MLFKKAGSFREGAAAMIIRRSRLRNGFLSSSRVDANSNFRLALGWQYFLLDRQDAALKGQAESDDR